MMGDGTDHLTSHDDDNEGHRHEAGREEETEAPLPPFKAKTKSIASQKIKKSLLSPWPPHYSVLFNTALKP